jgi:hypothetical protein
MMSYHHKDVWYVPYHQSIPVELDTQVAVDNGMVVSSRQLQHTDISLVGIHVNAL